MFNTHLLDELNSYKPNLNEIEESAKRTYGEANAFFEMVDMYLTSFESRISNLSKEEIYDKSNAIATQLALCCEKYLKAIYIFENNIPENNIDQIWDELKKRVEKVDKNGNLVYLKEKDGNKFYVYVKTDVDGNIIKDDKGNPVYIDDFGNEYKHGQQGKKCNLSGHELDRLIDSISLDSKLLLHARMLSISMSETDKHSSITLFDHFFKHGVVERENIMSDDDYLGWIEQHKKTFEEARYGGQSLTDVNIEFLYHLATQLKAVAQFKIEPTNSQRFTLTEEELRECSKEIIYLAHHYEHLLSEELVRSASSSKKTKDNLKYVLSLNTNNELNSLSSNAFFDVLTLLDINEISLVFYINLLMNNLDLYEHFRTSKCHNTVALYTIAFYFKMYNISFSQLVDITISIKKISPSEITAQMIYNLIEDFKTSYVKDYIYKDDHIQKYYKYYSTLNDVDSLYNNKIKKY